MPTVSLVQLNENAQPSNAKAQEFSVSDNGVLFDELDDQGKTLPHGCLSGSCGSCRILVIEGSENLSPAGAIERDTIESLKQDYFKKKGEDFLKGREIRLSCRARVKGNITFGPL